MKLRLSLVWYPTTEGFDKRVGTGESIPGLRRTELGASHGVVRVAVYNTVRHLRARARLVKLSLPLSLRQC